VSAFAIDSTPCHAHSCSTIAPPHSCSLLAPFVCWFRCGDGATWCEGCLRRRSLAATANRVRRSTCRSDGEHSPRPKSMRRHCEWPIGGMGAGEQDARSGLSRDAARRKSRIRPCLGANMLARPSAAQRIEGGTLPAATACVGLSSAADGTARRCGPHRPSRSRPPHCRSRRRTHPDPLQQREEEDFSGRATASGACQWRPAQSPAARRRPDRDVPPR